MPKGPKVTIPKHQLTVPHLDINDTLQTNAKIEFRSWNPIQKTMFSLMGFLPLILVILICLSAKFGTDPIWQLSLCAIGAVLESLFCFWFASISGKVMFDSSSRTFVSRVSHLFGKKSWNGSFDNWKVVTDMLVSQQTKKAMYAQTLIISEIDNWQIRVSACPKYNKFLPKQVEFNDLSQARAAGEYWSKRLGLPWDDKL